ncbi:MAG: TIGR00153 family protein [Elusimicrobia bacterium]|nr:TIGR00153 family protein [Elusimicrobiota bacterium]
MLGNKKEKEVKDLIMEHLKKVEETLDNMFTASEHYINGESECARNESYQVHLLETEADTKRREVIEKLYLGAFMPILRDDLVRLIAHQDKIADRAESCCDFCLSQRPRLPDEYKDKFLELLKASVDTYKPYKEAIEHMFDPKSDYKNLKQQIKEVNTKEEIADTVEWQLTKDIFASEKIDLAHKMHLHEYIFHIVSISDVIEDAADDIDRIIVKQQV